MELKAKNVREVLYDCMFTEDELDENGYPKGDFIPVKSIMFNIGFHPDRLSQHKDDINDMISELKDLKDGISFLNLCFDKNDRHWGEQIDVDNLIALGIGIGRLSIRPDDRHLWKLLPGSVPLIFDLKYEE